MVEFNCILKVFLEGKNFSADDLIHWYEADPAKPNKQAVPRELQELNWDYAYLDDIKPEFPLALLNFLRDDSLKILRDSQELNQTPCKASFPEKYDYTSPMKTLQSKRSSRCNKEKQQMLHEEKLFQQRKPTKVLEKIKHSSNHGMHLDKSTKPSNLGSSSHVNAKSVIEALVPEESIEVPDLRYGNIHNVPFSSTPNIIKLEKRFTKSNSPASTQDGFGDTQVSKLSNESFFLSSGSDISSATSICNSSKLDIRRSKNTKTTSRRSLDSQINACESLDQQVHTNSRQKNNSGGKNKPSTYHSHKQGSSSMSLGDFLVTEVKQGKKKNKNRNRRSDTAIVEQEINESAEFATLSEKPMTSDVDQKLEARLIAEGAQINGGLTEDSSKVDQSNRIQFCNSKLNDISVENEICTNQDKSEFVEDTKLIETSGLRTIPKPVFSTIGENEGKKGDKSLNGIILYEEPMPDKVTFKEQLDKLIIVYCYCLEHLLVPNVLVELNHLLLLLTVKNVKKCGLTKYNSISYFNSVHNCVYFAANVLSNLQQKLLFGFQSLLQDLKKIERIELFCPGIHKKLGDIAVANENNSKKHGGGGSGDIIETFSAVSRGDSVHFQPETDSRINFPDAKTFQNFKRQRDQFFKILQEWKDYHTKDISFLRRNFDGGKQYVNSSMPPGTSLHGKYNKGTAGGGKGGKGSLPKPTSLLEEFWRSEINDLTAVQHPVNMYHLASLFQQQLLQDSINDLVHQEKPILDLFDCSVQDQLKKDPVKLKKLFSRYAPPTNIEGPYPNPEFPQTQEFFRDFLRFMGGNYCFIEHLKNELKSSITELNEKMFDISRIETSLMVDIGDKDKEENELYVTIVKLKIMAKFLGYIESLPYQCQNSWLHDKIVRQRKNYVPCLNLYQILKDSVCKRRLILTLPWIIEFCAVQDYVTMQLPYYQRLFKLMVQIYKNELTTKQVKVDPMAENHLINQDERLNDSLIYSLDEYSGKKLDKFSSEISLPMMNRFNAFFLCINLGWFFENKNFPRELFIEVDHAVVEWKEIYPPEPKDMKISGDGLDYLTELRPSILNVCCPYISELKVVLYEFCTGFKVDKSIGIPNKRRAITKHIPKTGSEIQKEMEEHFLHNQSWKVVASIKLVAVRIASNIARTIEENVREETVCIEKDIKQNLDILLSNVNLQQSDCDTTDMEKVVEDEMQSQINILSAKSYSTVKNKAQNLLKTEVAFLCDTVLRPILPSNLKPTVINECIKIATSRVIREERDFIIQNVTKEYFDQEYMKINKKHRMEKKTKENGTSESMGTIELNYLQVTPTQDVDEDQASWALIGKTKQFVLDLLRRRIEDKTKIKSQVLNLLEDIPGALSSDIWTNREENLQRNEKFQVLYPDFGSSELDTIVKCFESVTADLAIVLCAYQPSCFQAEVQEAFINFWKFKDLPPATIPPAQIFSMISARNLTILSKSQSPMESWSKLEAFIGRLLKTQLLVPLALEQQCLSVLQEEWPQDVLNRFASCLQGIHDSWRRSLELDYELEDFQGTLLDWIAWFVQQPNDCDYDLDDFPELR